MSTRNTPSTKAMLMVHANGSKHEPSNQNGQNVQAVSKHSKEAKTKAPKTHARHWEGRLFKNSFTRNGERHETADWCVKIGHLGRRETFNLDTPNKETAASRALNIYRRVIGAGWEPAIAEYKPKAAAKAPKPATIGEWLETVKATAEMRPVTFNQYSQSLRQIAAQIADISDQPSLDEGGTPKRDKKRRIIILSRFDSLSGGRAAWLSKVEALPLSVLSAPAVQRWKVAYIARAGNAPDARRRAENTAATLLRCARALFSEKARKYAAAHLTLPDPLPFAGVELPKKGSTAYQSRIDAGKLIEAAQQELQGEPFKIFVLGLFCGLRKREIDLLTWAQVDFEKAVLRIERTEHFEPKSEDSVGEIDLDAELVAMLRGWKAQAMGAFVIESTRHPVQDSNRVIYRCEPHFDSLYAWLRTQGVTARKPLHELRKELGAILASKDGIFAAQSVLRHAQISTTAAYYADKKRRISSGLGYLLIAPATGNVIEASFTSPKATQKPRKPRSLATA